MIGLREIFILIYEFIFSIFSHFWHNIKRINSIIVKNIKVLIRSKSSALIVVFGPLLIVSLVGLAFNSSTIQDIRIGVYSDKYSDVSNSIVKQMQDESYSVKKIDSRDLCISGIKKGDFNMCLVFSPDMSLEGSRTNKITFYVDYTRVNLVYKIMDDIGNKLSKSSNKLSLELTQNLIDRLDSTKDELAKRISSVNSLSSNNEKVYEKIDGVKTKLSAINLTYNERDLSLDEVISSIVLAKKVAEAQNISLPDLNTAISKTEAAGKKLNWVGYEMRTAREEIDKNNADLILMAQILQGDKRSLDDIKASVERITSGIQAINVTTAENIVAPIQTDIQPIVTETTYLGRLLPTFLVLVLMFVCIMLSVTLVLSEKETNAYFRNFITPARDFVFIIGTYLTCLIIVAVQVAIIITVMKLFLENAMATALNTAILPILLITSMFIFIGMIIGYLFNSQETAILAALFIVSGSLFFSNTVLPMETISPYVKWLVTINPFVLGESILKKILIFGFSLRDVNDILISLVKFILGAILAVYVSLKYYKKTLND